MSIREALAELVAQADNLGPDHLQRWNAALATARAALAAQPAQAQPLTDEQIDAIAFFGWEFSGELEALRQYARAVERAVRGQV